MNSDVNMDSNINITSQVKDKSISSDSPQSDPHSPLQNISTNSTECWSPRFEFDAPRYTNFSVKKYRETRKLLNKIVLNQDEEDIELETLNDNDNINNNNETVNFSVIDRESKCKSNNELSDDDVKDFEFSFIDEESEFLSTSLKIKSQNFDFYNSNFDSSETDIDEWFSRFHPLQEPLRPMTPPGPLISPERERFNCNFNFQGRDRDRNQKYSPKSSPIKLSQATQSTFVLNSPAFKLLHCDLNTPSKGPNTRIGLRSKPARVLKSSAFVTSISPSSPIRPNFTSTNSPDRLGMKSKLNYIPSSPFRSSLTRSVNISSPTKTAATSNFYYNHPDIIGTDKKSNSNTFSPIKQIDHFNSKNIPSSPLRKAVGILNLETNSDLLLLSSPVSKKRTTNTKITETIITTEKDTDVLKRYRPDKMPNNYTSTNNNIYSNNSSSSSNNFANNKKKLKSNQTDLEDIKKLLNQHNNRLKPKYHNKNA